MRVFSLAVLIFAAVHIQSVVLVEAFAGSSRVFAPRSMARATFHRWYSLKLADSEIDAESQGISAVHGDNRHYHDGNQRNYDENSEVVVFDNVEVALDDEAWGAAMMSVAALFAALAIAFGGGILRPRPVLAAEGDVSSLGGTTFLSSTSRSSSTVLSTFTALEDSCSVDWGAVWHEAAIRAGDGRG